MSTGVSCGVASTEVLPSPVDSQVRLFRLADAAQYRAKRAGAHQPVVAGRSVPDDPDHSPADRRVRRGRLSTDVQAALESALAVLDGMPEAGSRERLEAVADHVRDLLDAAGWFLSHAQRPVRRPGHGQQLGPARGRAARRRWARPGGRGVRPGDVPGDRAAIERAGSFFVEAGMPGNDPAEEAALVTAGYLAVVGAGAPRPERRLAGGDLRRHDQPAHGRPSSRSCGRWSRSPSPARDRSADAAG